MSQAKVDHKKELKHDRKKIVKKQKRERIAIILCSVLVVTALFGWFGYSIYQKQAAAEANSKVAVDLTPISDYLSSLTDAGDDSAE